MAAIRAGPFGDHGEICLRHNIEHPVAGNRVEMLRIRSRYLTAAWLSGPDAASERVLRESGPAAREEIASIYCELDRHTIFRGNAPRQLLGRLVPFLDDAVLAGGTEE